MERMERLERTADGADGTDGAGGADGTNGAEDADPSRNANFCTICVPIFLIISIVMSYLFAISNAKLHSAQHKTKEPTRNQTKATETCRAQGAHTL